MYIFQTNHVSKPTASTALKSMRSSHEVRLTCGVLRWSYAQCYAFMALSTPKFQQPIEEFEQEVFFCNRQRNEINSDAGRSCSVLIQPHSDLSNSEIHKSIFHSADDFRWTRSHTVNGERSSHGAFYWLSDRPEVTLLCTSVKLAQFAHYPKHGRPWLSK